MTDTAASDPNPVDERKAEDRREVLRKMGTIAAYTAPVLFGTMVPTRSARASGGDGVSNGGYPATDGSSTN